MNPPPKGVYSEDNLHMKFFSTKFNIHFSSPIPTPRYKETGAGGRESRLPPLKSDYFTAIISCSVKTVANRYRHTAIITSTGDKLFIDVNVDDLE